MDFSQRFVVLDIETTGINFEYFDEPTEIALVEIVDGKLSGNEEHFYLKPRKAITLKFLQKVFGKNLIKTLKVKNFEDCKEKIDLLEKDGTSKEEIDLLRKELEEVEKSSLDMFDNVSKGGNKYSILPKVREFIGDSIVIGHNVQFDVNFLNYWFNSMKVPLIQKYICTMTSFKNHFGTKHYNLGVCCEHYGISLVGAHNALIDTKACANLFLKEIEEFPMEIDFYDYSLLETYANFKKRVMKTNYESFANLILSSPCNMPKNIEDFERVEIDSCKNLFFKFKKPVDVAKMTGFDESSVDAIFIDWVNCININKHQDLVKDRYLKETCLEMLRICESDEELEELSMLLFGSSANYFYLKLFDKLENKKDLMQYDLNDFDYYFVNMRDLVDLSKKIGKDISYIYKYLLIWINEDQTRFLQYRQFFKDNYKKNSTNENQKKLYEAIESSKNKDFIVKRIGVL